MGSLYLPPHIYWVCLCGAFLTSRGLRSLSKIFSINCLRVRDQETLLAIAILILSGSFWFFSMNLSVANWPTLTPSIHQHDLLLKKALEIVEGRGWSCSKAFDNSKIMSYSQDG